MSGVALRVGVGERLGRINESVAIGEATVGIKAVGVGGGGFGAPHAASQKKNPASKIPYHARIERDYSMDVGGGKKKF